MSRPAPTYDLVLLLDPQAEESARAKLVASARDAIAAQGELVRHDEWGDRALTYPIDHKSAAEYHLMQFHAAEPGLLRGLDRSLRLADEVLRFRIVKLKPGVPSAPDMRAPASAPPPSAPATPPAPAPASEPTSAASTDQPAVGQAQSPEHTTEGGAQEPPTEPPAGAVPAETERPTAAAPAETEEQQTAPAGTGEQPAAEPPAQPTGESEGEAQPGEAS